MKVGPIEKELTKRYFAAKKKMAEYKDKSSKDYEYWRGAAEALVEAARYAEGLEI